MLNLSVPGIPDRDLNEDEIVVVIALRRLDPPNPTGDPSPDMANLNDPANELAQKVVELSGVAGFDPERSYVTVASLTDTEQGGAVTLADLAALGEQAGNPDQGEGEEEPPAPEPPTEDPGDGTSGDPEPEPESTPEG